MLARALSLRWTTARARLSQILDLFLEDSRLNVYAGELEVRPPGVPTTRRKRGIRRRPLRPGRDAAITSRETTRSCLALCCEAHTTCRHKRFGYYEFVQLGSDHYSMSPDMREIAETF